MKRTINSLTALRIVLSITMLFVCSFSVWFYVLYALCAISDILDGFLARKFNCATQAGAQLDSVADFVFAACTVIKTGTILISDKYVLCAVCIITFIKCMTLVVNVKKFGQPAFLHTYLNKCAGICVFAIPLVFKLYCFHILRCIIFSIAFLACVEEFLITLKSDVLQRDIKSIIKKDF